MLGGIVPLNKIDRRLMCLMFLSCYGVMAQDNAAASTGASGAVLQVTHILGFENISSNAKGDLSIQGNALRFQKSDGSGARITVGSIQDVFLGEQDKQVGGTPMALGKVAAPYGGGRVISLFAHKKYDTVTLQYLDPDGGFHGAIFQLSKGQGQVLENELEALGAHVTRLEDHITTRMTQETKSEVK